MSIMPNDRRGTGMNTVVRTMIFWSLMVLLAVVLWQMVSNGGSKPSQAPALAYSGFMAQVDARNVQTAKVVISQNTADLSGSLKQPANEYRTTVPRDTLTALMDKLREQGTSVQVSEGASSARINFVLGILPILLLVGFWIYMMRMRQARAKRDSLPNQPSPGALG
jgi:ATP-dependent Zn protease